MKRVLIIPFFAAILALAGCLKGNDMNIDPKNTTSSFLQMEYLKSGGTNINSGLTYFGGGALTYPAADLADTALVSIDLAGPVKAPKDLAVTLGPDANALQDNYSTDSIKYVAMPDSDYSIVTPNLTIKTGSRIASSMVIFYPAKIDPTKNFMLPLTATGSAGYTVSGNFGHIYFHTIGNPLAGAYNVTGSRINYVGAAGGAVASTVDLSGSGTNPKTAAPTNPTTVLMDYANFGSADQYTIKYDPAVSLTDITVSINITGVTNLGIDIAEYDPTTRTIHIKSHYTNATPSDRVIEEWFTHQ